MRPPHLIVLLMCFVGLPVFLTFFSLLHGRHGHDVGVESSPSVQQAGIWAFFSFRTPSTLFPSSAIISLTDDNSTFFLARPADFGSLLPSDGLSGQLWVGSGFGDDGLGRAGTTTGAEGELGCSDVPGWAGGGKGRHGDTSGDNSGRKQADANADGQQGDVDDSRGQQRRSDVPGANTLPAEAQDASIPPQDDGTDDHLHHPLPGSFVSRPSEPGQPAQHEPAQAGHLPGHADIQSLQESAEISGKVVLLSRGGCGFLEKVKWVQRRGGTALIVGDNTQGGPLVTMYARGDTSNITIPSLFTSHTTSHLLASLIPPGGSSEDTATVDGLLSSLNFKQITKKPTRKKGSWKNKSNSNGPTFTAETETTTSTSTPVADADSAKGIAASKFVLNGRSHLSGLPENSRRPPSSGSIAWFGEKWADDEPPKQKASIKPGKGTSKGTKSKKPQSIETQSSSSDNFVIGVQDWRDPDLVGTQTSQSTSTSTSPAVRPSSPPGKKMADSHEKGGKALAGGSITPGSGEYGNPGHRYDGSQVLQDQTRKVARRDSTSKRWFRRWFLGGAEKNVHNKPGDNSPHDTEGKKLALHKVEDLFTNEALEDLRDLMEHDGLWVTLTPTNMSTSPFFDTLLVLVVSPLVTLTVVYALLLLRSRIRRRRWRAPKSVVDRLPVRTYHTMTCSSTSSSSSLVASPKSSSPTSPLLQASPCPAVPLPRPRSRTTSGIGDGLSPSLDKGPLKASLSNNDRSRKPYSGRQVECVVCLEEYVDGHSRVMSLPCGHEFHAECM